MRFGSLVEKGFVAAEEVLGGDLVLTEFDSLRRRDPGQEEN